MFLQHFFQWTLKPISKIAKNEIIRIPILVDGTIYKQPFLYHPDKMTLLDDTTLTSTEDQFKIPLNKPFPIHDYYTFDMYERKFEQKFIFGELDKIEVLQKINLKERV